MALDLRDPLIAWLTYRGEMVSAGRVDPPTLSFWLVRSLQDRALGRRKAALEDEFALEQRREAAYPSAVSRVAGFFAFADEASAVAALRDWGFEQHAVVEVGILAGSRVSEHDAQWITTRIGEGGSRAWMDRYWAGDACPATRPVWELLVDGRAIVFGTEAREEVRDRVDQAWPKSLALLELARVAVELDSDLGLIVPMVLGADGDLRVEYCMSSADMTDESFLQRLSRFDGPRNSADLHGESDLVLPDLRGRGFRLEG